MTETAARLHQCRVEVQQFSPQALADYFHLPSKYFRQSTPAGPILFFQADCREEVSYALRGTIFWPKSKEIVRGYPRSLPTSDYTSERLALITDTIFAKAAHTGSECIVEPKLYGATIRVYSHDGDLYCATDVAHDGGNPLVGAGVENTRSLGIDYGNQAARILSSRYGNVERLIKLGYTAVFVFQLPEFAPDASIDHADMILVDAIDPDYVFVDRLEKERIAEDYGLKVVELSAKMTITTDEQLVFLRRSRALEHQAQAGPVNGAGGYMVKGRINESSDQAICTVEPSSERDRRRDVSASDLTAVVEEITGQFSENIWADEPFSEGLILDYLGSRHRSVRWRVTEYLNSWRGARQLVGLGKTA